MTNNLFDPPVSPGAVHPEDLRPFFRHAFCQQTHRLHTFYTGFWTAPIARHVLQNFRTVLQEASRGGRSFTLLDDCRTWPPQPQEVVEIANKFVDICRDFPIARNAMVIPSALVRMQVRRTVQDFDVCEIFETFEEADQWLAEVETRAGL
ncbi:MAG: hypothetical protein KKD64_04845 [Alphaproteobacteria bacterium]|nr:hypothetical protein [Alphaproteobacteria bacterium]MBU0795105.1 hypothetical protein [Alphaproteobacteria bacterium]MBU0875213.1 hypothetical protein [Alphaproteobacteria bacterium]MBU1768962.1 hypothetical protein [Alphaproteobacteria bacterium]